MKTTDPAKVAGIFSAFGKAAPAYLMILLPKCSLCLAAYLNLFSLTGLSLAPYAGWVVPVLILLLVVSLVTAFLKARKMNDYRAFGLLLAGMSFLMVGKVWVLLPVLTWFGFALIVIAAVIQVVQSRRVCSQDLLRF